MSEWISVNDRLPKFSGNNYLAFCSVFSSGKCTERVQIRRFCKNRFAHTKSSFVTHWMPLPNPPKEEA